MQNNSPNTPQRSPAEAADAQDGKLFVFNLAKEVCDADLRPLFQPYRPVYCNIALGKKGTSRRFAFVLMHSRDDAEAAMAAVQGRMLMGRPLEVKWATAPEPDQADLLAYQQTTPVWLRKVMSAEEDGAGFHRPAPAPYAPPGIYVPPHQRGQTPPGSLEAAPCGTFFSRLQDYHCSPSAQQQAWARAQAPPLFHSGWAPEPALAMDHEGSYMDPLRHSHLAAPPNYQQQRALQHPPGLGPPACSAWAWGLPEPALARHNPGPPLDVCPCHPPPVGTYHGSQQHEAPAPRPGSPAATARPPSAPPGPADAFAAISAWNLNTVVVTRQAMGELAKVEAILGGSRPSAADAQKNIIGYNLLRGTSFSVLCGAYVRVRLNGAYTLRRINATELRGGGLAMMLEGMTTPVLPEHVSGTNPLLCANPDLEARQELEELHASMVYRGKRLTKQELAAAAWRLRAGELWQDRHAGEAPAQRLAALAGLVVKLEDATEIEWRRRNVQSLDPAHERSVIKGAFQLPWAAATWMEEFGPVLTMKAAVAGGRPVRGVLQASPGQARSPSDASEDDLISAAMFAQGLSAYSESRRAELAVDRTPAGRGSDASSPDSCGFNTPFHGNSLAVLASAQPEEMAGLAKALDDLWSLSSPEEGGTVSVSPASSPVGAAAATAKRSDFAAVHQDSVWLARSRAAERARIQGSARPVEASPKAIS